MMLSKNPSKTIITMKKTVKLLALAVVSMALMVACKAKTEPVEEPAIDTTVIEEVVNTEEEVAEEPVVEEPVKKTTKKAEPMKADASKVTIKTDNGNSSASITVGKTDNSEKKSDASKVTIKTNKGTGNGSLSVEKN